jgi:hypothetical protein
MNGISVLIFLMADVIAWRYAAIMALAAILGGYAAARIARRVKPDYVRAIVVFIGFVVAAWSYRAL